MMGPVYGRYLLGDFLLSGGSLLVSVSVPSWRGGALLSSKDGAKN